MSFRATGCDAMERRTFLKTIAATGVAGATGFAQNAATPATESQSQSAAERIPRASSPGELRGEMLYRKLGRTGVTVSAIGMGGSYVGQASLTDAEATRLIRQAIDRGLTFMDNCWDYNEGRSEERMGQALQDGYRQKAFLMTKIDGRDKLTAESQINQSLTRLKTDHLDLLQFHEILRYEDPDRIFAPDGAIHAVLDAQKAGKVRYIGFTGHKDPHIHLYMLEVAAKHGFHFDTCQMPLNVMDAHYRSFAQLVVPELVRQQIAVLGMKSMGGGDGIILQSHTVTPIECLHYALNLPTSVVITGINKPQILDQAFEAAKTFRLMDEQQVAALISKTQQAAMNGRYELFKTSSHFDGTARHPDWLGADAPSVQKLAPRLPT
jgi:predicted aldo/keto reductase-like oxidoreductase